MERTFTSIYKALQGPSLLVFDCIDAERFLPYIEQNPRVVHDYDTKGIRYFRETAWFRSRNSNEALVEWTSTYFKEERTTTELVGNDVSTFRVFYVEEIKSLLAKCGFQVLDIANRKTYAFDTFVVVARKQHEKI